MPSPSEIRATLLEIIDELRPREGSIGNLQSNSILRRTAERLGIRRDIAEEQKVLTEWASLFNTGYLAWGHDLNNESPPFCHLTQRGDAALVQVSRDPANPDGYMAHLEAEAALSDIARSYLLEALSCYTSGLHKSAAVMLGCASERIILDLKDSVVAGINSAGQQVPNILQDWRIKKVLDGLRTYIEQNKKSLPRDLRENYESYWAAFTQQIRVVRNDVGHPNSIEPVNPETVHAGFLVFPSVAHLANQLKLWAEGDLK